jgi:hypothetical protein
VSGFVEAVRRRGALAAAGLVRRAERMVADELRGGVPVAVAVELVRSLLRRGG